MFSLMKKARYYAGYILFFVALIYAVVKAPSSIWQIDWYWTVFASVFVFLMFVFEIFQFYLFLFINRGKIDFWLSWKMNSRKAVLNIIFPMKPGTIYAATIISQNYQVGWSEYVRFLLYSTAFMIGISFAAAIPFFFDYVFVIFFFTGFFIICLSVDHFSKNRYLKKSLIFTFLSVSIYGCRLAVFWTLLMALGQSVSFYQASCFAISINILAQISITPGNMGVREVCLGILAPFLSINLSTGVLAGVIFQLLRLVICSLIMIVTDFHKSA